MDVVNVEQAIIAEEAGACAVMALERVPADIRSQGGVARMSDPGLIKEIKRAVTIPVMAKARIGHFVEAQILESIGVDYIDESEVLTVVDEDHHINKHKFRVPFVCGCRNLGEALRRVREGAAMIRTKGEAGTGNVVEAVRHVRSVMGDIRRLAPVERINIVHLTLCFLFSIQVMERSGFSVREILQFYEKFPDDDLSREVFKGRCLYTVDPKGNYNATAQLKRSIETLKKCKDPECKVLWNAIGKFGWESRVIPEVEERITAEVVTVTESSGKKGISITELQEILNFKPLKVRKEDISSAFENCLSEFPPSFSIYYPKEIKIFCLSDVGVSFKNLLGAGTKVLDAILYKGMMNSSPSAFSVSLIQKNTDGLFSVSDEEICHNISVGRKALAACYVFVWNQGYLPNTGEDKVLPKFIRSLVFNDKIKTHGDFAALLSSASLRKFPGSCFLSSDLSGILPTVCVARCKMNIAGNKVIRYAVMANCFSDREYKSADEDPDNFLDYNASVSYAIEIRQFLAGLENDFDAQLKNHPMSKTRVPSAGLTKKLTRAVLWSITYSELQRMASRVIVENRLSWMKDTDFWGVGDDDTSTVRTYPIFEDTSADFNGTSMETIKAVWGKN